MDYGGGDVSSVCGPLRVTRAYSLRTCSPVDCRGTIGPVTLAIGGLGWVPGHPCSYSLRIGNTGRVTGTYALTTLGDKLKESVKLAQIAALSGMG